MRTPETTGTAAAATAATTITSQVSFDGRFVIVKPVWLKCGMCNTDAELVHSNYYKGQEYLYGQPKYVVEAGMNKAT